MDLANSNCCATMPPRLCYSSGLVVRVLLAGKDLGCWEKVSSEAWEEVSYDL